MRSSWGNACYDATSLSCWPAGLWENHHRYGAGAGNRFPVADTDRWLQSHVQMSVADIVEKEGWGGFRARETAALEAVSAPSTVVATGGGIILTEYNRRYMHRVGVVIYLCAPVSTLVNRLEAEPEADLRPTLTGKPLSEEVREVLEQRDALYRETAHYIIDATKTPAQVVSEIIAALPPSTQRLQGDVYT
ncbi:shikimate kinase II [Salmonella enterica subsp. enterica serovar Newport str. WA_14881]|nr:shikimate kinase II [Salmonella enterica subsp. enterica serovar Newport str. WA_14881]